MDVLLIEPNYKAKYPPLGLMKISTFHKNREDNVRFFKGKNEDYQFNDKWDRIYISTVFTYYYQKTVQSIELAKKHVKNHKNIYVGGVAATLLPDLYKKDTGITTIKGLLNKEGKIGLKGDSDIDTMIPDYSLLDEIDYKYPTSDAYIGYATRGCGNHCKFCAVDIIEPDFCHYKNLKNYINGIIDAHKEKKDLLLLDNNVLKSNKFNQIIKDILDLGFEKDATFGRKKRYVDFNQGLDGRLFKEKQAKLLSKIAIRPARIAFDHVELYDSYVTNIKLAAEYDILHLSNYLLFNYKDKPIDLYKRIKVNIRLNEELGTNIFSFPMKYVPLTYTERSYIGENWSKKQLRAIQVILNATHGVVGPKREYVMKAFGKSQSEFEMILLMPEELITHRVNKMKQEADEWTSLYESLESKEKRDLYRIVKNDTINKAEYHKKKNVRINKILTFYPILFKRAGMKLQLPII